VVADLLKEHFPDFTDVGFTAKVRVRGSFAPRRAGVLSGFLFLFGGEKKKRVGKRKRENRKEEKRIGKKKE